MYDINRKHFIFRQSTGRTVNIFYREAAGICLSTLNKKGAWHAPAVIYKNAVPEFSAYMDKNDGIHILHQDKSGSVTYTYNENSVWNSTPINAGRNTVHRIRQLQMTGFDTSIYLFYTIEYPDSCFLYFQKGNITGSLLEPHVLDSIEGKSPWFSPAVDSKGNISIFYIQKGIAQAIQGYRAYDSSIGRWSSFVYHPASTAEEKLSILAACFDDSDNLHLLSNKAGADSNELIHLFKASDQEAWDEKSLGNSALPFEDAALAQLAGTTIAYWTETGSILYCKSKDNGTTWSQKETYLPLQGKQIYCMSYSSNDPAEGPPVSGLCLPGSYSGGYSLAFYDNKQQLPDSVKPSTINIEEKEENIPAEFSRYYEELFIEIEKVSIRQTLLENEINNIKKQLAEEKVKAEKINTTAETDKAEKTSLPAETAKAPEIETPKEMSQPEEKTATEEKAKTEDKTKTEEKAKTEDKAKAIGKSASLLPGAGFSFVTPEYLKSLKK